MSKVVIKQRVLPFTKAIYVVLAVFLLVVLVNIHSVFAQFNPEINYQGRLLDSAGEAVADGGHDAVFGLYTAPSGGSAIWTETHTGGDQIVTNDGLFSVMLGSITPLTGVNFNQTLYLGVTIGGDAEMSPRKIIGAVPAAFVAGNAFALDGATSTQFLRSDEPDEMVASSTGSVLTIRQNGSGAVASFFSGANEVLSILNNGNVGIGTTSPSHRLTVAGDIALTGTIRDSFGGAGTWGQILGSNGSGGLLWLEATLANLMDVNITSPSSGQLLSWDGSSWVNVSTSTLGFGGGGSLFTQGSGLAYLTNTSDALVVGATSRFNTSARLNVVGGIATDDDTGYYIGNTQALRIYGDTGWYTNLYVGSEAAAIDSSAGDNVAVGIDSLMALTEGYGNTAIGTRSLMSNIEGGYNTAVGSDALMSLEEFGFYNTALGAAAGAYLTSGEYNVFIGNEAGDGLTTGSNNIAIGFSAQLASATGSNQLSIGNLIYGTGLTGAGAGNIGIGTDSPASKLTVAGDIALTGTIRDSFNGGGSWGQVLGSNGSGGLVWIGAELANLMDTSISSPSAGQLLSWNGSAWANVSTSTLGLGGGGGSQFLRSDEPDEMVASSTGSVLTIRQNGTGNIFSALGPVGFMHLTDGGALSFGNGFNDAVTGTGAFAGGYNNTVTGWHSFAMGFTNEVVSGEGGVAFGRDNYVSGWEAFVSGRENIALGHQSAVFGVSNYAYHDRSFLAGEFLQSGSSHSMAIGRANVGVSDAAFEVGIGTSSTTRANALTVLKNGDVGIGTTTPAYKLTVAGDFFTTGAIRDSLGNAGTSGQVLSSTGTGTEWVAGGGGGSSTLADLTDVDVSSPSIGQVLSWDGTAWANINPGTASILDAYNNIPIGVGALNYVNSSTTYNIALGQDALWDLTSGTQNIAFGQDALGYMGSGSNNIGIGYSAGSGMSSGSNNIAIGFSAQLASATGSNQLSIGNLIYGTGLTGAGAGNIGIGTTTPAYKLTVAGDFFTTGAIRDSLGNAGTSGQVLSSTATGTLWITGGGGGSLFTQSGGLTYLTNLSQNLAVGTTTRLIWGGEARLSVDGHVATDWNSGFFIGNQQMLRLYEGPHLGYSNLYIGTRAQNIDITEAFNNTAMGNAALQNITTGSINFALGAYALHNLTTGWGNLAVGAGSLQDVTSGGANTAFGNAAGRHIIGSDGATFIGDSAGHDLTSSPNSVIIGSHAARNATVAAALTVIGSEAGMQLTTGGENVLIGYRAGGGPDWMGWGITSGGRNIAIGYEAMVASATGNNQLSIGNLIYGTGLDGVGHGVSSGNIGIGTTTPAHRLTVSGDLFATGAIRDSLGNAGTSGQVLSSTGSGTLWITGGGGGGSLFTENGSLTYLTNLSQNLAIGTSTPLVAFSGTPRLSVNGSLAIDRGIGVQGDVFEVEALVDSFWNVRESILKIDTGTRTYAFGSPMVQWDYSGNQNIGIGGVGGNITTGSTNILIGPNMAGANLTTGGTNIFIGQAAGYANTDNHSNTFIGNSAGMHNRGGNDNVFLGAYAGDRFATTSSSVLIGVGAGSNGDNEFFEANDLTIIGNGAAGNMQTGAHNNTLIGRAAAGDLTTGNSNVMIGMHAGGGPDWFSWTGVTTGSRNIIIGYEAMVASSTGDYQLSIGNLIYGTGLDGAGENISSGNIGIGQKNPNTKLHIGSSAITDGANLLTLEDTNSVCVFNADSGSPTCGSDERLKKDIKTIEGELEIILGLEPKFWRFKSDNSNDASTLRSGFIAQEVEIVLPELVSENTWIDGSQKKFLNISGMVPYIVGAIKELWEEVMLNRSRIEALEQRVQQLEAQNGGGRGSGVGGSATPPPTPTNPPVNQLPEEDGVDEEVVADNTENETEETPLEEGGAGDDIENETVEVPENNDSNEGAETTSAESGGDNEGNN